MVYDIKCYGKDADTMKRLFIETQVFRILLDQCEDQDLEMIIKNEILKYPLKGDMISGCGGIRKLRIANQVRGKGKSGGYRVLYLDLPQQEKTYLLLIYDKDDLENITSMQKGQLKKLVGDLKNEK